MSGAAPPAERGLLRAHVGAALEDVIQARVALERGPVDPELADRVSAQLAEALHRQQRALVAIEEAIDADAPSARCWSDLAAARRTARGLLGECLAYLSAGLTRGAGLGADLCRLADRLLEDVSRRTSVAWNRFTVLATGELIGEQARIVRLPFPAAGVWTLPIALHELGHHIVPQLGRTSLEGVAERPFATLLDELEAAAAGGPFAGDRARRHALELLADAFATHTGGPAFAFACAYLRFDPERAAIAGGGHPGDGVRMHAILRGLERSDETDALGDLVPRLRETWERSVRAASGEPPAPDPALDARIDRVHALLAEHARAARFDGWWRARQLAEGLADDPRATDAVAGLRPWDVVNAGWIARMRLDPDAYGLRALGGRIAEACRAVLP